MKKYIIVLMLTVKISYAQVNIDNCSKADDCSRIVSAGGSITEIIYLLKQEDNIVGIDVTSVYPKITNKKKSIGYVRNLSTEGILSMSPTLIIGEDDMGPPAIIKQLKDLSLDLRIIEETQTTSGIIEKIECIGEILNVDEKCKNIIQKEIYPAVEELTRIKSINEMKKIKVMLILSMQGSSPIVAGNNTTGDSFINMIGAKNIYSDIEGCGIRRC